MDTQAARSRIRFGRFEFDGIAGELFRDGRRVRLQEQPRQVLTALLERPGEIVTRENLRERLWKSDTFVDFEHGLNTAVKKARQALGDSADTPEFIETLARRGYRFIGRIEAHPPESAGEALDATTSTTLSEGTPASHPAAAHWWRRPVPVGIAVLLVAAAAVAIWTSRRGSPHPMSATSAQPAAQLAVLPLRILAPSDTDAEYIGVGAADAITTRLANTRQLALRPTSAVLPFKDAQSDPSRVATALGVEHLLLGTIQRADETYRISVQLVRANGVVVWGGTFDEPRIELLQLQDDIAQQVVAALRVELSAQERARLHVRYTQNPLAYETYLRGRSLLVNYNESKMREAIAHFERALALDPEYALARAGVATASAWFSVRYAYESDALAWGKRAEQEAHHALAQDGSLADAHFAIGSAAGTLYGGFQWNVVLDRSAAALALDSSLDLAHLARMRAYYHLGLFEEAVEEARLARTLNPGAGVELARLEVATELFRGEYGPAIEHATALLKRSEMPAIRHYLGLARYYAGDVTGARDVLASAMRGGKPDVRAQASLASIEAAVGMRKEARARIAQIAGGSYMDHHVAYSLGAALAQLGDADASLAWLEQAADTGFPCYPWFRQDSLLAPIRGHDRFVRLVERLRAAHDRARHRPAVSELTSPGARMATAAR